ncbi:MAG TPA: hypothetical protein PLS66_09025, partial [Tepiditoga sp.]|nr:hypothetical protein [Tepiditoga sp.]
DDIFNFQGSEYDYALMYSVYPHFTDKTSLFEKIYALLSKGGAIIIAHSESREKINEVHSGSSHVENHILDSAEKTVLIMEKYFKIIKIIDSDEMYYIKGIKE